MNKKINKDILIQEHLQSGINIGDVVTVEVQKLSATVKKTVTVVAMDDEFVYYNEYGYLEPLKAPRNTAIPSTYKIGYNPKGLGELYINTYQLAIEGLLYKAGWDRRADKGVFKTDTIGEVQVPEICWNPFVFDKHQNTRYYQRDFCWDLIDKQALIDSIYLGADLGKVIVRKRSFSWVEKCAKLGYASKIGFYDIVDGKQRLSTLFEFIEDKFCDSEGYYFSDFSENAKTKFLNYSNLSYGELPEKTTDLETIKTFLVLNISGRRMESKHIDLVKSFEM